MKTHTRDLSTAWQLCLLSLYSAVLLMVPSIVYASPSDTPMGNVLCTVAYWVDGNYGKGLATLAITILGVGATLGKISWGMAMVVGIGVAIIFGCDEIAAALGAGIVAGDVCEDGSGNNWTFRR